MSHNHIQGDLRRDLTVTKAYPKEFRDEAVQVARNRQPDVALAQIAKDLGVHSSTLHHWIKQADAKEAAARASTRGAPSELHEVNQRITSLEHEIKLLRTALTDRTDLTPTPAADGNRSIDPDREADQHDRTSSSDDLTNDSHQGEPQARPTSHLSSDLTPQEWATWNALSAVLVRLPAALDHEVLEETELSHFEYALLAALAAAPHVQLRVGDLAARTHASLTRTSHTAKRLARIGLLSRRPAPDDGRATIAQLTESGQAVYDKVAPKVHRLVRAAVIEGLNDDELSGLEHLAKTITGRLASIQGPARTARRRQKRAR